LPLRFGGWIKRYGRYEHVINILSTYWYIQK
jgi:hypothetical protein